MDKCIMKKALIQNIVFDEFDKIDYINIFNANENKYLRVYSEEMGSININTCRKHSLVDYVEIDDNKASFKNILIYPSKNTGPKSSISFSITANALNLY